MPKLTNGQIASALGVSVARVSALRKEGMPDDSIESVLAWRQAREDERRRIAPEVVETLDDGSIAERINSHRIKVNLAGQVWEQSIRDRDPNQGKFQTAYNQSLKTLLDLEEEQERRAVQARQFIKASESREAMTQLMSEILTRLDKLGLDCAEQCNPENPARAVKVLDGWVRKVRAELSQTE
jgi:hypothetical protein